MSKGRVNAAFDIARLGPSRLFELTRAICFLERVNVIYVDAVGPCLSVLRGWAAQAAFGFDVIRASEPRDTVDRSGPYLRVISLVNDNSHNKEDEIRQG